MILRIKEWCRWCQRSLDEPSKASDLFCVCPTCGTPLDPVITDELWHPITLDRPTFEKGMWECFNDQAELEAWFKRSRHSCAPVTMDVHHMGPVHFLPEYRAETGSWKDREVAFTLARVFNNRYEDFCLASGTNAAVAFGKAAVDFGIGRNAHIFIPKHAENRTVAALEDVGVERFMIDLHVVDGDSDVAGQAARAWSSEHHHPFCSGWANWGRRLGLGSMWWDYPTMTPEWYFQGVAGALGMWGLRFANRHLWTHTVRPVYCQPDVCAPFAKLSEDQGRLSHVFGKAKPITGPVVDPIAPVLNARNVDDQIGFFRRTSPHVAVVTRAHIITATRELWDLGFHGAGLEAGTAFAGLERLNQAGVVEFDTPPVVNISGRLRHGDEKVLGC